MKKHNEHRSKIAKGLESKGVDGPQPTASDMRELVWNDELAEVAQRYQMQLLLIFPISIFFHSNGSNLCIYDYF